MWPDQIQGNVVVFRLTCIDPSLTLCPSVVQIGQYKESFQSRKQLNRNFNNGALWIDHARVSRTYTLKQVLVLPKYIMQIVGHDVSLSRQCFVIFSTEAML